jgi:uncharacterized protein YlxP (DUF503 family)
MENILVIPTNSLKNRYMNRPLTILNTLKNNYNLFVFDINYSKKWHNKDLINKTNIQGINFINFYRTNYKNQIFNDILNYVNNYHSLKNIA